LTFSSLLSDSLPNSNPNPVAHNSSIVPKQFLFINFRAPPRASRQRPGAATRCFFGPPNPKGFLQHQHRPPTPALPSPCDARVYRSQHAVAPPIPSTRAVDPGLARARASPRLGHCRATRAPAAASPCLTTPRRTPTFPKFLAPATDTAANPPSGVDTLRSPVYPSQRCPAFLPRHPPAPGSPRE
jgi:hypothetical protein